MKSTLTLVITALTALSLLLMAPAAFAGNRNGSGDGTGPISSIIDGIPVEVTGIVAGIGTSGNGIGIDTGVEIVTVYGMGPVSFWDAAGIAKPEIGEDITVKGYEIVLTDGTFKIIAGSVLLGGEELVLRDPESGAPLWRGLKGKDTAKGSGDCILSAFDQTGKLLLANQTRTKDKKKDGSCLNPVMDTAGETMILAKGGHGPGDGTGNGGNGPKDGSGHGNKSGTCTNA